MSVNCIVETLICLWTISIWPTQHPQKLALIKSKTAVKRAHHHVQGKKSRDNFQPSRLIIAQTCHCGLNSPIVGTRPTYKDTMEALFM